MSEEKKLIENDEIDLLHLFKILWDSRKKIVYITSAFTIIGIIYSLLATPWYEASVKIMPSSESRGRLSQFSGIAAMVGIDLSSGGESNQALYPEIIKSNFVLDKVLEHKFKTQTFERPVALFEFWETDIDSSELGWKHEIYEKSKKTLRDSYIESSIDKKTSLMTVTISAPYDPTLAADMANYIVEQLDYYNKYLRNYKAKDQRQFIEKGLEDAEKNLEKAQNRIKMFKENNRNVVSPEKELALDRLETEVEVQKTVYLELKKQLEIAKIEEVKETETLDILEKATVPIKKSKPIRSLIAIISCFAGFIFSILFLLFSKVWISIKERM